MRKKYNPDYASFAILLVIALAGSISVFQTEPSITGAAIVSDFCYENLDSCIDLSGDGFITVEDEDIFAKLITNATYRAANPDQMDWADFDDNGFVDQTDFQQCFVPMRDYAVDYNSRVVTCNVPEDNLTNATTHVGCTDGCADLNGDGYVNNADYLIMKNLSIAEKDITETYYPMADLTGDSKINLEDRNCIVGYMNKVVMCNLHVQAYHTTNCPDLTDDYGIGNDGRVNLTDQVLFDYYYELGNLKVDFNGDNAVNPVDRYIFDQYYGKVVECNLYHAPWHTGGVDANNSDTGYTGITPIGGVNIASQNFTTTRSGMLTKIRIYMNVTGAIPRGDITVDIHPDSAGSPNLSVLIDSAIIYAFDNTEAHWETAYFRNPAVLSNNTKYHARIYSTESANGAYDWMSNSAGLMIEPWTSTACADFNGDGYVNSKDESIINKIPDGMTSNGAGAWNLSFDLNLDNEITDIDVGILNNYISGVSKEKPVLRESSISETNNYVTFGNNKYISQSFIAINPTLNFVELRLAANTLTSPAITIEVRADNGSGYPGEIQASKQFSGILNKSFNWYNFSFDNPGVPTNLGSTYHLIVYSESATTTGQYNWSNATYASGNSSYSTSGIAPWTLLSGDRAFRFYYGNLEWNESYDLNNDNIIDANDVLLIQAAVPSYNNIYWTPLVDFNAIFGTYEQQRDKILGFDAYKGKILKCGLPTYTLAPSNGRCEPDAPSSENYSNSIDCVACNYDGFCDSKENIGNCSDCEFIRNLPKFGKFNESTSTDFTIEENLSAVQNAVFEIWPYGRITFLEQINASGADFDSNIDIFFDNASVNISALPQLNTSADIWLYNINFTYPKIMRNSLKCDVCSNVIYSSNTLKFNVTGFYLTPSTSYSAKEAAPDVSKFNGTLTTNFGYGYVSDIENVSGVRLHIEETGYIQILENLNASEANYTRDVEISRNGGTGGGGWIDANLSSDSRLNKSALVNIYYLNLYKPVILYGNSTPCPLNECQIISYPNYPNGAICNYDCDIVFNVSLLGKYYIVENTTAPQFVNGPVPAIEWNATQNATVNLSYYFYDTDNNTLVYNAITSPGANVLVTISNGVATLSSINNWYGVGWVNFSASDVDTAHENASTGPVMFVAMQNLPPQLDAEIPNQELNEDENITFSITDYFSDPNSDSLTYGVTFLGNSNNISVTINQTTGNVLISLQENWNGQRFVNFFANDSQYVVNSNTVTITVNSINDAPVLNGTMGDIVRNEDENYSIYLPGYFKDVETLSSDLEYSIVQSAANFTVTIENGWAVFVPKENWFGSESFYFIADDGEDFALSNTFSIFINSVNDNVTRTSRQFNLTWNEDSNLTVNLTEYMYDVDGNAVYFYNLMNYPNINMSVVMNHITGIVKFVPKSNWNGRIWINFSLQDYGSIVWEETNLTVMNINDAPTISLSSIKVIEDSYNDSVNLSNYVSDVDNTLNEINWSYMFANESEHNITININNSTKIINVSTNVSNWFGNDSIWLYARDLENITSRLVNIYVMAMQYNLSVNFTALNYMRLSENTVNDSINLSDYIIITNYLKEKTNWSCISNVSYVTAYADNDTKIMIINATGNFTGYANISCNAYAKLKSSVDSFIINVTKINTAPSFILLNQTVAIGDMLEYQIDATDPDEGDVLSYYKQHATAPNLKLNETTGMLTYAPTQVRTLKVNITVCDNSMAINNCTKDSFVLNAINNTNSTFINSYVNETFYNDYLSNVSGIYLSVINISNVSGQIIYVNISYLFNSVIENSTIQNCDIYDSHLVNAVCKDAVIDPSYIYNSNTTGSTVIDSNVVDSIAVYSDIRNSTIENSDVRNSDILNSADCSIVNSSVRDANISGCIVYTGTITYPNGTIYNASSSGAKSLYDIVNYAPISGFSYSVNALSLTANANSTDANIPGELNDILIYNWSFGDGNYAITQNISYTYASAGTYNVTLNTTDKFGLSDYSSTLLSVSSAPVASSGGGGGGGGGSRCYSNWQCSSWTTCSEGIQTRICTDLNKCRTPSIPKPIETQECGCIENWVCSEYGECTESGIQIRQCTDVNNCGTLTRKPTTSSSCTYYPPAPIVVSENCYDGIQNQDETGIDCGGRCRPCTVIPSEEAKPLLPFEYILIGILLFAGIGFMAYGLLVPMKKKNDTETKQTTKNIEEKKEPEKNELKKEKTSEVKSKKEETKKEVVKEEVNMPVKEVKYTEEQVKLLANEIASFLNEGYDEQEIKKTLQKKKYPVPMITEAFGMYEDLIKSLGDYITETRQKGFSDKEIESELLKEGWFKQEIKDAFKRARLK